MKFNFDLIPNRRNTNSLKWDVSSNELPMWVADMDFETALYVKDAIINKAKLGAYGYTIVPDLYFESYRNWWLKRHNFKMNIDWMIYSNGVVAAISSIVRKITSVGENVLIQSPVYNVFYNSIINNGRFVLSNDLIYKNGEYKIDFIDLEKKLSNPQTTLMILCNPHNPIGKIWSKEELLKIGELCSKYNVLVISDEIHCDITTPGISYIPFASVSDTCKNISITCLSASKTFNIAGLQSACIVVPNSNLRYKIWRGINTDEVGEPNFFSVEANISAFTYGDEWVNELNEYIFKNKNIVYDFIKQYLPDVKIVYSDATYLLWLDMSYYSNDSKLLCDYIKKSSGLIITNGSEYGASGKSFVRINIATSKENVIDGMKRFKKSILLFKNN